MNKAHVFFLLLLFCSAGARGGVFGHRERESVATLVARQHAYFDAGAAWSASRWHQWANWPFATGFHCQHGERPSVPPKKRVPDRRAAWRDRPRAILCARAASTAQSAPFQAAGHGPGAGDHERRKTRRTRSRIPGSGQILLAEASRSSRRMVTRIIGRTLRRPFAPLNSRPSPGPDGGDLAGPCGDRHERRVPYPGRLKCNAGSGPCPIRV